MKTQLLTGLSILLASSVFACGGAGDRSAAAGAPGDSTDTENTDPSAAGTKNVGTGGSSAGDSAGSSGKSTTGGSAGKGVSTGDDGNDSPSSGGSSSGGSSGKGGSAGNAGSGSNAGSAGTPMAGDDENYDPSNIDSSADPGVPPIGDGLTTLSRREELMFVRRFSNQGLGTYVNGWMADDSAHGNARTELGIDLTNQEVWDVARGDLDGDTVPEAIVGTIFEASREDVYGRLFAKDHARISMLGPKGEVTRTLELGSGADCIRRLTLATGDLDGDGRDELIVSALLGTHELFTSSSPATTTDARLYVLQQRDEGLAVARTVDYAGVTALSAVAADVDGDAAAKELTVLTRDALAYFAEPLTDHVEIKSITLPAYGERTLVAGNFDTDSRNEVIVLDSGAPATNSVNPTTLLAIAFDDAEASYARNELDTHQAVAPNALDAATVPTRNLTAVAADVNGDGQDELCLLGKHLGQDFLGMPSPWEPNPPPPALHWSLGITKVLDRTTEWHEIGDEGQAHLAAYNADADKAAELALYHSAEYEFVSFLYDEESDAHVGSPLHELGYDGPAGTNVPFIVAGDFDGDSLVVRYTGDHAIALAKPIILAALAAPPCQAGIEQNCDDSSTDYGITTTQSTETTSENSVSVGVTLSVSGEIPFGIFSAEVSTSLEAELTQSHSHLTSVASSVVYHTGADYDSVVFAGNLFHLYTYEVVSAPAKADNGDAIEPNGTIVVSIPIGRQTWRWSTAHFNAAFPDPEYQIGRETFDHTPLDVKSYPTAARRDQLMGASHHAYKSAEMPIGDGNKTADVALDIGQETSNTLSYSLSVSFEAGVTVGGVGVSASAGFSTTESATVTLGTSKQYTGAVSEIALEDWEDYNYGYGLFVHDVTRKNGMVYPVVNYWVNLPSGWGGTAP